MNMGEQTNEREEDKKSVRNQRYLRIILIVVIGLSSLILWGIFNPATHTAGEPIEPDLSGTNSDLISQNRNGIEVTATNIKRSGNWVKADVCHTLPDQRDWLIWEASLSNDLKTINEFGAAFIEGTGFPATSTGPGKRCVQMRFMMPLEETVVNQYRMSIDVLYAQPDESEYCSTYLEEVRQELEKRGLKITVQCSQPPVGGIEVEHVPDGMSIEEANDLIHSREFLYALRGIQGPWMFEFSLKDEN
jgi:hypothetical protein